MGLAVSARQAIHRVRTLELIGGALCLDFTNTVGSHNTDHPEEYLTDYSTLVAWSERAGILSRRTADDLLQQSARCPEDARTAVNRAIAFRETLYRLFSSVADGIGPKSSDLAVLNECLVEAFQHMQVVAQGDRLAWEWQHPQGALDQMLWPIARSAADLLTSDQLSRVRECASENCGWLFVDWSKNHSRRWCDMGDCGNRAKAHRFYMRKRGKSKTSR